MGVMRSGVWRVFMVEGFDCSWHIALAHTVHAMRSVTGLVHRGAFGWHPCAVQL